MKTMNEFKQFHVTRNLSRHAFALDDEIYGTPETRSSPKDWVLQNPELYIQRLRDELSVLEVVKSDLEFVMNEKFGISEVRSMRNIEYSDAYCDAHVYHTFHSRSFSYAEKIAYLLQTQAPESIEINFPKAMRQLAVLSAAIDDTKVSIYRFSKYVEER